MISQTTLLSASIAGPTVWGLPPTQLHDRYWAARGIQVVRQGEPSEIVDDAELFLLTEPRTLTIFKLSRVVETLSWIKPEILSIRIHDGRERGYRERIITGPDNSFVRFERHYADTDSRLARVALTPDRRLAHLWQRARDPRTAWQEIRKEVERSRRSVISVNGNVFDRAEDAEVMEFMRALMQRWPRPDATVNRISQPRRKSKIWADQASAIDDGTTLVGPLWVGAGRRITRETSIVGPKVLWDDPASRPPVETLQWQEIEPSSNLTTPVRPRQRGGFSRAAKRLFDITFALVVLAMTLPLYPFVMLAIWLEDGRPFFFAHRRETLGGRLFHCLKFRSMRRDADQIKQRLIAQNQADGPQFFMNDDPRLTSIGKFIRKTYIDELPQFFNVLMGEMSIVGPRPSPHRENQYCPPWREARLSVRPGITGLWQVRRTRRRGMDFQEWIKYDIEYVENISWRLDLGIIWETVCVVVRGVLRT